MIKALFFVGVGAVATYLYLNPGDFDGAVDFVKGGVNDAAQAVVDVTETSAIDKLKKEIQ